MGEIAMGIVLIVMILAFALAFYDARTIRFELKSFQKSALEEIACNQSEHKREMAKLSEELESERTRRISAEKRARFADEHGLNVVKARSASQIRAMNDAHNEQVVQEEQEKNANTSFRAS